MTKVRRPIVILALVSVLTFMSAPSAFAKAKLLLQDLEAHGVPSADAAVLTTSTCQSITKLARHSVLCGDDLRTLMRFGALASNFGACEGAACFAKIGRALKARYVVSGKVSRLDKTYVLSLSVVDTVQTKAMGRSMVKANSLAQLQLQVEEAVGALFVERRR
ncbi:MAG: hypothetical protein AAFN74_16105 [Myxococcota bacterium]